MYAYLVEVAQDRSDLTPRQQLAVMQDLAESYGGPWDDIRPLITDPEAINYTWFESHVVPGAWHRGRVVLIGDAVHTTNDRFTALSMISIDSRIVMRFRRRNTPTVPMPKSIADRIR
jgi:hypothetical protein